MCEGDATMDEQGEPGINHEDAYRISRGFEADLLDWMAAALRAESEKIRTDTNPSNYEKSLAQELLNVPLCLKDLGAEAKANLQKSFIRSVTDIMIKPFFDEREAEILDVSSPDMLRTRIARLISSISPRLLGLKAESFKSAAIMNAMVKSFLALNAGEVMPFLEKSKSGKEIRSYSVRTERLRFSIIAKHFKEDLSKKASDMNILVSGLVMASWDTVSRWESDLRSTLDLTTVEQVERWTQIMLHAAEGQGEERLLRELRQSAKLLTAAQKRGKKQASWAAFVASLDRTIRKGGSYAMRIWEPAR
jgi:hypothetical protein